MFVNIRWSSHSKILLGSYVVTLFSFGHLSALGTILEATPKNYLKTLQKFHVDSRLIRDFY